MTAPPGTASGRVPFTLLGGYLGAGKTTLLNRLLTAATGRRVVALVNDVGAVNVDAALVAEHDGATLTLTNGCVCCALGDDLVTTLEFVRSMSPAPDHVVMELSGVGEPARLAPWANTTGFRLDGVVVVADAEQIVELAGRRYVGDTIRAQLGRGRVPPSTGGHSHHQVATIPAVGLTKLELVSLVDGLGAEVVRAKGLIRCTDVAHPVEVHVVGRRRQVRERVDLGPHAATDSLVVVAYPPVPTGG